MCALFILNMRVDFEYEQIDDDDGGAYLLKIINFKNLIFEIFINLICCI